MTVIATDSQRFSNVIKYELAPDVAICRDKVIAREAGATDYTVGLVLGKTLTGGAAVATAAAGNTGTGTFGTITVGGTAVVGTYTLRIEQAVTDKGLFAVFFPDGKSAGTGMVGSAFTGGGLSFTLGDATDFVVGDSFTIAVTGTEKWKAFDPTATDGSHIAAGVFIADVLGESHKITVAATTDTKALAITRGPVVVSDAGLVWGANVSTDAQKAAAKAQLDALNIRVSTAV